MSLNVVDCTFTQTTLTPTDDILTSEVTVENTGGTDLWYDATWVVEGVDWVQFSQYVPAGGTDTADTRLFWNLLEDEFGTGDVQVEFEIRNERESY